MAHQPAFLTLFPSSHSQLRSTHAIPDGHLHCFQLLPPTQLAQNSTDMAGSLYRRRRIIWTLLVLSVISLFYLATRTENSLSFGSWSLPAYLKDIGFSSSSSPARLIADAKTDAGRPQAQEIHGLLHFVTAYPDRELNEQGETIEVDGLGPVKVEPQEAVDMKVYAPDGDRDWSTHMENLKEQHPLVVFSKSYCPYAYMISHTAHM